MPSSLFGLSREPHPFFNVLKGEARFALDNSNCFVDTGQEAHGLAMENTRQSSTTKSRPWRLLGLFFDTATDE
jgi:hypothetical protein